MMHLIFSGLLHVCLAWSNEELLKSTPAATEFTIATLHGNIPSHFWTLLKNPNYIGSYAQELKIYEFQKYSTFKKIFLPYEEQVICRQLNLNVISKKWWHKNYSKYFKKNDYQVFEYTSKETQKKQVYVFLGYKQGADPRTDSYVNAKYKEVTGITLL